MQVIQVHQDHRVQKGILEQWETQDLWDYQDWKDSQGKRVTVDQLELRECQGHRESQDPLGPQGCQENLVKEDL